MKQESKLSNFNIEIDLLKLKGAKVQDIRGRSETRRCIVIPIDNETGTVKDSYYTRNERGELITVPLESVTLRLTAFELRDKSRGNSHLIKPAFSRQVNELMTDKQRRQIPFIGAIMPWAPSSEGEKEDW